MKEIYTTKVLSVGPEAGSFADQGMVVTFGDQAPDMLKEFCYIVEVTPLDGELEVGQSLYINDTAYALTAVGNVAAKKLAELGHLTIVFNGAEKPHLPGAINVEGDGKLPPLAVGDVLRVVAA